MTAIRRSCGRCGANRGWKIARDLKSAVEQAEMLIVAVRPGSVGKCSGKLRLAVSQRRNLCVSLAAGIPLEVARVVGGRDGCARCRARYAGLDVA